MKTLKITLVALFSIGLLTAVLPSSELKSEPISETPNHEVKKPVINLTAMIDKDKIKQPSNG